MKASWDHTFQRAAETETALALSQHTKEVTEKAAKLEEDILSLEKVGGTEIQAIVERKKQELKAFRPKLPRHTQPLKDHENVVSAIRELDEKGNGKTKELEDKKTRLGAEELKIRTNTDAQTKAIREKMFEQIKGIETAAGKRIAAKRDETIAIEKDLLDLAKDIAERRKVLTSKVATVATELANAPEPPANAVMVPVLPGSNLHSNHIKPEAMLQAAMKDQGLLSTGAFSPEQAVVFTKWSLTYINQMSLTVPES